MIGDDSAFALHIRATRGEALSGEEQALLGQWYGAHDNAEQSILSSVAASAANSDLQLQVTAVLERCIMLAQRIQELSNHNDDLRRDITQLRRQVVRHLQSS